MIAYTEGTRHVRHVWGMVCKSWGLHGIAQTKREARVAESSKLPGRCGPHRLVKLSVKS